MHFTREPIIETVVTAREGYKLSIRSSKDKKEEEFTAEAVEVVSFGSAIFYRCLERPKAFLLPVSDYEIVEIKEQRITLKTATEKTGKAQQQTEKTPQQKKSTSKRKSKKKRTEPAKQEKTEEKEEKKAQIEEVEPVVFSKLFPPPSTLIKEKLIQSQPAEIIEANLLSADKEKTENGKKEPEKSENTSGEFPEPEPLDQPIFNPDFLEEKEETAEEVTKTE